MADAVMTSQGVPQRIKMAPENTSSVSIGVKDFIVEKKIVSHLWQIVTFMPHQVIHRTLCMI